MILPPRPTFGIPVEIVCGAMARIALAS